MGQKEGDCCAPFAGELGPRTPSNTTWPGPRSTSYQVASLSIEPFGHNIHGPKIGWWLSPFLYRELGPHLTQTRLGRGLPHTKRHLSPSNRLATMDMGRKLGLCPFSGGGAGSPTNTMSPSLILTSVPSGILMHPAIWPQLTWAENWGLGTHVTQSRLGQGLPSYQVTS